MNGTLRDMVWLDRIKDLNEVVELAEKSRLENHGLFVPTHVIRKNGDVCGYFSVSSPGFPVTFAWLGQALGARESFSLITLVENLLALGGSKGCCLPVPENSPFFPLMESMGYQDGGKYHFFVKTL